MPAHVPSLQMTFFFGWGQGKSSLSLVSVELVFDELCLQPESSWDQRIKPALHRNPDSFTMGLYSVMRDMKRQKETEYEDGRK